MGILKQRGEKLISQTPKIRYALLDELRGFMVLCMVFYHGFLTVYDIFGFELSGQLFDFFTPIEPVFAGGFIVLSGLMCGFSRSNIRRGAILSVISVILTVVTIALEPYLGQIAIYFGILHLLGFSMLFCGIFNFALKRVNRWVGLIACLILFVVFYGVPDNQADLFGVRELIPAQWYLNPYLFPLGITTPDFYSADYFSIIPWSFLFVAGYYLYKFNIVQRYEGLFAPKRIRLFGFVGRHALIVYILHQPIIYLICLPFVG